MKKIIGALFALCLVFFLLYAFVRSTPLTGFDPYFFLGLACNYERVAVSAPIFSFSFFSLLLDLIPWLLFASFPCSPLFFQLLGFIVLFISSLVFVLGVKRFFGQAPFWAYLAPFASGLWVVTHFKIENDILAYPFIVASVLCFYIGFREKNERWKAAAIGFAVLATAFWRASILLIFVYAVSWIPAALISIFLLVIMFFFDFNFFGAIFPINKVLENLPFTAIALLFGLLFGLISIILPKKKIGVERSALVSFLLAVVNAKLAFFAVPFLAMQFVKTWLELPKSQLVQILSRILLISFLLSGPLLAGWIILNDAPSQKHFDCLQRAIDLSEESGKRIENGWTFGYWIDYLGGQASRKGGPSPVLQDFNGSIAVSSKELDCPVFCEADVFKVYNCP